MLACSSAGGGLRIAVVGSEELVTAEAGRRVALSSGGKVVAVLSRTSPDDDFAALAGATAPDVVLLTGGTDDGDEEGVLTGAGRIAASGWLGPVVVAGNRAARAGVATALAGYPLVVTDNVVPRIGVLEPTPARRAVREMFLAHVIGGKGLSARADFTAMVHGPTPDLVLTGVEVLAAETGEDVAVVDIGGATTDVHSVVRLDPEDAGLAREVVASTPVTRTVEGDLGMRWSATTHLGGRPRGRPGRRGPPRGRRAAHGRPRPAARRPGRGARGRRAGRGSRHPRPASPRRPLARGRRARRAPGRAHRPGPARGRPAGRLRGRAPARLARDGRAGRRGSDRPLAGGLAAAEHPRVVIDRDYVLAAVGLLAASRPAAAGALARSLTACPQT